MEGLNGLKQKTTTKQTNKKEQGLAISCLQCAHFRFKDTHRLKVMYLYR